MLFEYAFLLIIYFFTRASVGSYAELGICKLSTSSHCIECIDPSHTLSPSYNCLPECFFYLKRTASTLTQMCIFECKSPMIITTNTQNPNNSLCLPNINECLTFDIEGYCISCPTGRSPFVHCQAFDYWGNNNITGVKAITCLRTTSFGGSKLVGRVQRYGQIYLCHDKTNNGCPPNSSLDSNNYCCDDNCVNNCSKGICPECNSNYLPTTYKWGEVVGEVCSLCEGTGSGTHNIPEVKIRVGLGYHCLRGQSEPPSGYYWEAQGIRGRGDIASQCVGGKFLDIQNDTYNTTICVSGTSSCPKGTFQDSGDSTKCTLCTDYGCELCSEIGKNKCKACDERYYLSFLYLTEDQKYDSTIPGGCTPCFESGSKVYNDSKRGGLEVCISLTNALIPSLIIIFCLIMLISTV